MKNLIVIIVCLVSVNSFAYKSFYPAVEEARKERAEQNFRNQVEMNRLDNLRQEAELAKLKRDSDNSRLDW